MAELSLLMRTATDQDNKKIHSWLKEQNSQKIDGSFLCHWQLTEEKHQDKKLIVAISNDEPIAYIWEDFGILEVRHNFKRKGVGKQIVEYALDRASEKEKINIQITCAPKTSIPFWKKMGFKLYNHQDASYVFHPKLHMPKTGKKVSVVINVYPETALHNGTQSPIKTFSPLAIMTDDGVIHLDYRVAAYIPKEECKGDIAIKIIIEHKQQLFAKAKHEISKKIGVNYQPRAFAIEKIHPTQDV